MVGDSEVVGAEELPAVLTVGRLAEAMILVSDNAATNLLISLLGEDHVNVLARELGLRSTVLHREMMNFAARSRGEENLTSASDAVALLAAIRDGGLLFPKSRQFVLDLLGRRRPSDIPIPLPPGARFLRKTGELEDVRNVAGLVVHPEGTFALAVLNHGNVERAAQQVKTAVSDLCNAFLGVATGR